MGPNSPGLSSAALGWNIGYFYAGFKLGEQGEGSGSQPLVGDPLGVTEGVPKIGLAQDSVLADPHSAWQATPVSSTPSLGA